MLEGKSDVIQPDLLSFNKPIYYIHKGKEVVERLMRNACGLVAMHI